MLPLIFILLLPPLIKSASARENVNEILRGHSILYGVASLSENSSLCYEELDTLYQSIEAKKLWALRAMDSSGSPGPGFLYGNNLWIGSHSQCADISNKKLLEINHEKVPRGRHNNTSPEDDYPPFPLVFAMIFVKHNSTLQLHTQLPLETTLQIGLCIPFTCASVNASFLELFNTFFMKHYIPYLKLYDIEFQGSDIKILEDGDKFMLKETKCLILLSIIFATFLLVIIGTIYDVRKHNRAKVNKNLVLGHNGNNFLKNTKLGGKNSVSETHLCADSNTGSINEQTSFFGNFLKCFSLYSNSKALVKTELSPDSVGCIHGLRFFGMMWVIMVHSVFYQADYISNIPYAYRMSEDLGAQILSNSTYSVDTYLFLSGFLLGYLFFKSRRSVERKNIVYWKEISGFFMMIFNRFLRLTPPYLITILASDVLYTYYRKTSALQSSEFPDELCSKYWWRNILYINNLYPRSEMCLSWSWYLSLDTQFFAIGSFLLILSNMYFYLSATLVVLLIFINIGATAYKSYSISYIPTMDEQLVQLDAIYDLPWNRLGPYFVGLITAYVLLVKLKNQLRLKESVRIFLWTVFPLLNLWILFTLYTRQLSVEFSAVYMGVSRTLWGVGLAWLLIACCTGNARALDKFLSYSGWIPLSRLTYCAYLLNPLVATMVYLGSESGFTASKASFSLTVLGILSMTFYIAFMYSMFFESPYILITKMIYKKLQPPKREIATSNDTTCNIDNSNNDRQPAA